MAPELLPGSIDVNEHMRGPNVSHSCGIIVDHLEEVFFRGMVNLLFPFQSRAHGASVSWRGGDCSPADKSTGDSVLPDMLVTSPPSPQVGLYKTEIIEPGQSVE